MFAVQAGKQNVTKVVYKPGYYVCSVVVTPANGPGTKALDINKAHGSGLA